MRFVTAVVLNSNEVGGIDKMFVKQIVLKDVNSPFKRIMLSVEPVLCLYLASFWNDILVAAISAVWYRDVFKNPRFCRTGEDYASAFFRPVLSGVVDVILMEQLSPVLRGSSGYIYPVCHLIVTLPWTHTLPPRDSLEMLYPLFCCVPHITMCLGRSNQKKNPHWPWLEIVNICSSLPRFSYPSRILTNGVGDLLSRSNLQALVSRSCFERCKKHERRSSFTLLWIRLVLEISNLYHII